jgi:3-hydroxymyristoyl/3-hydroxydecanoyl-(acyl carrier protein) dehydratase
MSAPLVLSIDRPSPDDAVVTLGLPENHPAFAGHFPDQPVLPGVVQTHWAIRLGDELLGTGCAAALAFKVKFRRVIQPGEGLELRLHHDRTKHFLTFEYRQQGEVASTGRIKLEVAL